MDTPTAVTVLPLTLENLFLFGGLGGAFVELVKHATKLRGGHWPTLTDLAASLLMILLGGGVAAAYFAIGQIGSLIVAMHLGATAPALVGAWVTAGPPSGGGGGGGGQAPSWSGGGAIAIEQANVVSKMLAAFSWRTV